MVVPYDEPDIQNDETIIRRINPDQHIVPDENNGGFKISSKAFRPSSGPTGGMSVDILSLIEADGLDAKVFVTNPTFTGSVSFTAATARDANLRIGYEPIIGNPQVPDNPYHGEVWGNDRPNKFSRSQQKALKNASVWFVEIPNVLING